MKNAILTLKREWCIIYPKLHITIFAYENF